jgi:hypothetical protein
LELFLKAKGKVTLTMQDGNDLVKDLPKWLAEAKPGTDKIELLELIFKSAISQMIEFMLNRSPTKNRLMAGSIDAAKANLIREFRLAPLGELQRSVARYEAVFDKTIKEILEESAGHVGGEDLVSLEQESLLVDARGYANEIMPMRERRSPGGIILPN